MEARCVQAHSIAVLDESIGYAVQVAVLDETARGSRFSKMSEILPLAQYNTRSIK